VITMEMFGKVRRMYYRDGMSRSAIARRTGLSRTTVKKWLRAPTGTEPKYRRSVSKPGKLDAFKDELLHALRVDARRSRRERRTALALLSVIRAKGYAGGYTSVKEFVRAYLAARHPPLPAMPLDRGTESFASKPASAKLAVVRLAPTPTRSCARISRPAASAVLPTGTFHP